MLLLLLKSGRYLNGGLYSIPFCYPPAFLQEYTETFLFFITPSQIWITFIILSDSWPTPNLVPFKQLSCCWIDNQPANLNPFYIISFQNQSLTDLLTGNATCYCCKPQCTISLENMANELVIWLICLQFCHVLQSLMYSTWTKRYKREANIGLTKMFTPFPMLHRWCLLSIECPWQQ